MAGCGHVEQINIDGAKPQPADGCGDCQRTGDLWVHLRMCATCGHVGCCDSSPNRHATAHVQTTGHPLVRSYEPAEAWWYCYVDDAAFELDGYGPLTDRHHDPVA